MAIMYCELCERPVEARRRVGGWTHLFGLLTLGVSYLVVPFYRRRCPICSGRALSRMTADEIAGRTRRPSTAELENRLASTTEELDTAEAELNRVRAERDFYRDLRGE